MTVVSSLGRVVQAARGPLLGTSAILVATTVMTAGLGFVYWWFAARTFSPEAVGLAAATVSAMTLLGYLAMLGLGTLLISEVHRRPGRQRAYVAAATIASGLAGLALGTAAGLVAPWIAPNLSTLVDAPGGQALFTLGVGLTAASFVLDQAVVGLLQARWRLIRNGIFALGKLALLAIAALALSASSGVDLYVTWVAGLGLSVVVLGAIALWQEPSWRAYRPDWAILRHLGSGALAHHALNLAVQAPSLALPVVVAVVLSTATAGYFYAAWMLAGFVSVGTSALSLTLFAVGARDRSDLARSLRVSLPVSLALVLLAVLALLLLGPAVLRAFGGAYAETAFLSLMVLSLAAAPGAVKAHFVQIARIGGRIFLAAGLMVALAVLEICVAGAGAMLGGLDGMVIGYALVVTAEASIMLPPVLRAARITSAPLAPA